MLILGLVLLVIGFIAKVAILQTIGIILLIVGAVLWILDRWDARLAAVGTTGTAPRATVAPMKMPYRTSGR
jgi:uncharacterized membrane protein HdeD (DUF308 family)